MPTLYICYVALYRCEHHDTLLRCRYEVAHRLQIRESPTSNSRAFLRLQESKSEGETTLYICYVALYRCEHHDTLLRSAPTPN